MPSLALALGVWSGSSRLFEIIYLALWYTAFNGVPALDFMGLGYASNQSGQSLMYLGLIAMLLVASLLGRAWQRQK